MVRLLVAIGLIFMYIGNTVGPLQCLLGVQGLWMVVTVSYMSESFTEGKFSCQFSYGLPLVQYSFLLLDQALPQVENCGLGLLTRPPPTSRGRVLSLALMPSPGIATAPRIREAGRVSVHWHRSADKTGMCGKVKLAIARVGDRCAAK